MGWPLATRTRIGFDADPVFLELTPGKWGPFYHVTKRDFSSKKKGLLVREYKAYATYSRMKAILDFKNSAKDQELLRVFVGSHKEEIEMDPNFELFEDVKTFFIKLPKEFERTYKRLSHGRWFGMTKSKTFQEANNLYNLEHLRQEAVLYLYEVWLNVKTRDGIRPGAFLGKVQGGSSLQLKVNNHAIECVSKIKKLDSWSR